MIDEALPPDNATRNLTIADPDDPQLPHLGVVGDTYTTLISGQDTHGQYALIDMLIPPGSGPPPHRHDFEEGFHVLEGEIEVTLRDTSSRASAGQTINIPALAPHSFRNPGAHAARVLCLVSPAGLEEYFAAFGDPVAARDTAAPNLTPEELETRLKAAADLASRYRIENL